MNNKKLCCILIVVFWLLYALRILLPKSEDTDIMTELADIINDKIDPCDDFHEFVCSNVESNVFDRISDDVKEKIDSLFDRHPQPTDGTAIKQYYRFYQDCKKVHRAHTHSQTTKVLYDIIPRQFRYSSENPDADTKLIGPQILAEIAVNTFMHDNNFLMPISVANPDENAEVIDQYDRKLYISPPILSKSLLYYDPKFVNYTKRILLKEFSDAQGIISSIMSRMGYDIGPQKRVISDMIEMEVKVAEVFRLNKDEVVTEITVGEAIEIMPEFDWKHYILTLEKVSGVRFTQNCKLENCLLQFESQNAIAEYLKIISQMTENDYVTYALTRMYKFLQSDPIRTDNDKLNCEYLTNTMFPLVMQYLYITETYTTGERDKLKSSATALADNITASVKNIIDKVPWIKNEEKTYAGFIEKLEKLQKVIAFPDHLLNQTWLDEQYNDFDMHLFCHGNCFKSTFTLYKSARRYITKRSLETSINNATDYTEVNAFADHTLNKVYIPLGILHQMSFAPDYVPAVKYGDAGFTIGHEIFHHFDPYGIKQNADGQPQEYISELSGKVYNSMTQCVIDEYNKFNLTDNNGKVYNIDGRKTIAENIADLGGILAAYTAFKSDPASNATMMSAVKGLTNEQLFFVSFARAECEPKPAPSNLSSLKFPNRSLEYIIDALDDTHAPSRLRISGVLRNFVPFRKAFKCPVNSNYAPEKHCEVFTPSVK